MKRVVRVATGLIVMLCMVFSPGMGVGGGRAFASGDGDPTAIPAGDQTVRPEGVRSLPDEVLAEKAANNTTFISSNTTVTNKTYASNVLIGNNATLTVGTNGKVVVNGDLYILGTLKITSGSLTVNGDIVVAGSLLAGGTGKIAVNKAAAGGQSGSSGGSLSSFGLVSLTGAASVTINKVDASTGLFSYGTLKMNSADATLTVNGTAEIDGESTKDCLTAGTLAVNGNFYEGNGENDVETAFCPGDAFKAVISGSSATPLEVIFKNPGQSYFTGLTVNGAVFKDTSAISIRKNLKADCSLNTNNARLYVQGNLNGRKMTLTSKYISPSPGASLALGGGTLVVNGIFDHTGAADLAMQKAADRLVVNGEFRSSAVFAHLEAGTIELNGNFNQLKSGDGSKKNTFAPGANLKAVIVGANRTVHFDDPLASYFTRLEFAKGASVAAASSNVSVNADLAVNAVWPCAVLYRGSLKGFRLEADSVTIPEGTAVTVGGGTLRSGSLTIQGSLLMAEAAGAVYVKGNLTAGGDASTGELTAGTLFVGGNITQSGAADSFHATDAHRTVLDGAGAQSVSFSSPSSGFASLYVINDGLDVATLPAEEYYDRLIVTGTTLAGIGVSASELDPAFAAGTRKYRLILPAETDTVTITPALLARYGDSSWLTFDDAGEKAGSVTVTQVQPDSIRTVTIVAHAADDLMKTATVVEVERVNPNLKAGTAGLGSLPDGTAASLSGTAFTVDLPATAASFLFAPVPDNPNAAVSVDGAGPTKTVSVPLGGTLACNIAVTAQDGKTTRSYTVVFTRHQPLSNLTVSSGKLVFNPATKSYSVTASVASVTLTATVNSTDSNGAVRIGGEAVLSKTIPLTPGATARVTVTAQDKGGKSTTAYTVDISTEKLLSGIKLSKGSLSPAFAAGRTAYNVYVSNSVKSVTVTPSKTSWCKKMTINGKAVKSIKLSPSSGGKATATIVCASGSGSQALKQTFTVTVYRIQPVSKISVSTGKLSPKFSVGKTSYTVSVPAYTSSVTVSVAKTASCKSLTINGKAASSVKLAPALGGSATAKIVATAQNGAKTTYTVTVKRAAVLKGITLSAGKLSPAFKSNVMAYQVTVPASAKQVTVTPVKLSGVKSVAINGKAVKSVTLKPAPGGSATATIVVTAGKTKFTYKVTIYRKK